MIYLDAESILHLHRRLIAATGGGEGVRSLHFVDSAAAQPRMTFDGVDLYPNLSEKLAALGFSLVQNHPFVDGNKRVGFAAMDLMARLNGRRLGGSDEEWEAMIVGIASGQVERMALVEAVSRHLTPIDINDESADS